jgi:hypothetical protein
MINTIIQCHHRTNITEVRHIGQFGLRLDKNIFQDIDQFL